MDADYSDLPDDELKEVRQDVQRHLRAIEQEMARRRHERLGLPLWWCEQCQQSYRSKDETCPDCQVEGAPFVQSVLTDE